jgi:hypothetical protein
MIGTRVRPAAPTDTTGAHTTDGHTADGHTTDGLAFASGRAGARPRRGRLWALLHAQAPLGGASGDVEFIEDDWQRMSARRGL